MHLPHICLLGCISLPTCHTLPPQSSIFSSHHPPSLSHSQPHRTSPAGIHIRAQSDVPNGNGDTASSQQHFDMPPVPVPSSPPSTWYPDNDLPSSSGAFTPVNLPTGWVIHPISSMIAMRPITVAASALERFYKDIISLCAQNFWSSTPDAPMLNANLQLGMLLLTIAGDPKSPGLPWGILALLAQGMLERAQR